MVNDIQEEWKLVVGSEEHYEVSNLGRIRSLRTRKIMRPWLTKKGYFKIRLQVNLDRRHCFVHRLVAAAFLTPNSGGLTVNHKNGSKLDNTPGNLEYLTAAENIRHAIATGLRSAAPVDCNGKRVYTAKLTSAEAKEILNLRGVMSQRVIATRYGVSRATISVIHRGKCWKACDA